MQRMLGYVLAAGLLLLVGVYFLYGDGLKQIFHITGFIVGSDAPVKTGAPPPRPAPPPPPAPVSAPSPAEAAHSALIREASQASRGHVAYNPPAKMRVGEEERITVRISRGEITRALTENMAGRGQPITESIEVGGFMRVTLDGNVAFDVTPIGPEDLAIATGGVGEWIFRVLPVKAGPAQILTLRVYLRVKTPDREELISVPALERKILVDVNLPWMLWQFWLAEWKWIVGGIASAAAAVAGYLLKRWWEKRGG